MAAKKATAKKVVAPLVSPTPMTTADKLRAAYAELDKMNVAVQEEMQKAYRFARDNNLSYMPPVVVWDANDPDQHRDEWDSSYC